MRPRLSWLPLVALLAWLSLAARRGGYGSPAPGPTERQVRAEAVDVLDGDTFRVEGEVVRLLGADTPERPAPWFRGDQEPWASRASDLARARIDGAQRVTLLSRGERDARGRLLAHLLLDGEPLAAHLVAAGLAFPTAARYGDGGFPEQAQRVPVLKEPPPFLAPWTWRRRHRR